MASQGAILKTLMTKPGELLPQGATPAPTMTPTATPAPPLPWALASLSLAMLLSSLGTSIANVGLPTLAQAFHAAFGQVQWVVLAYLLAITSLIVGAGRLGDVIGRRRVLQIGIGLFTLGALLCGLAPTLACLIAARALQGLGAAMMLAMSMALVADTVPKETTARAMGWLGTMSAIGTALGPTLGGAVIALAGWRWIFLLNLPLGLLALLLVQRCLPQVKTENRTENQAGPQKIDRAGFDLPGTLLLAATLGAYALAMTLGHGHFGMLNLALLLAAGVGLGLFVLAERRARSPLIRLSLLRDAALAGGLAMSTLVSTVMMATLVVGPFYLARGFGLAAAQVGLVLSLGPLAAALAGVPAGRITTRFGTQGVTVLALGAMAAACLALAVMPLSFGLAAYIGPIVIVTIGYALFQTANNTAVMANVAAQQRGLTSGMLNLSRNLGLISGASLMGAVFALATGTVGSERAEAVASGARLTFALAALLIMVALGIAAGAYRRRASSQA
jgi:EmrB/QacA subfamily drug resistance transporter